MRRFKASALADFCPFQFTHPGRGATHHEDEYASLQPCFNSRTPGGVRLPVSFLLRYLRLSFNSRTPGGVRHRFLFAGCGELPFQFTHPGRGATTSSSQGATSRCSFNSRTPGGVRLRPSRDVLDISVVSIHAPREGCDIEVVRGIEKKQEFQFTHPGRGATCFVIGSCLLPKVSIHAPREGCDYMRAYSFMAKDPVSIHAPREGCDTLLPIYSLSEQSFNSRTPGGVRRLRICR